MSMSSKEFAKTIVSAINQSVIDSENPEKRVVTNFSVKPNERYNGVFDVFATSNDGYGFVEREDEHIFSTCTIDESFKFTGKTVADLKRLAPNDFTEIETALNKLYDDEESHSTLGEDGCRYFNTNDDGLGSWVELLACGLFITSDGGCNWENIIKFKAKGFDIFAGDKDSFGWLTGCIQRGDGAILVYG